MLSIIDKINEKLELIEKSKCGYSFGSNQYRELLCQEVELLKLKKKECSKLLNV